MFKILCTSTSFGFVDILISAYISNQNRWQIQQTVIISITKNPKNFFSDTNSCIYGHTCIFRNFFLPEYEYDYGCNQAKLKKACLVTQRNNHLFQILLKYENMKYADFALSATLNNHSHDYSVEVFPQILFIINNCGLTT